MTTAITKESLAARIAELESGARSLKEDYTLAAYKMLLATMDSEPVAFIAKYESGAIHGTCDRDDPVKMEWLKRGMDVSPLYTHAQPTPVVPDEVTTEDCPALVKYDVTEVDEAWACGFNACRAAMLNGGKP